MLSKRNLIISGAAVGLLAAAGLVLSFLGFGFDELEKPAIFALVSLRAPQPRPVAPCPVCGRPVSPARASRTALMVKVDNHKVARPQSGLNDACLVYEIVMEGGSTRYGAIFACGDSAEVGPIRSARFSDAELSRGMQAVLVHCGGKEITKEYLKANSVMSLDEYFNGRYFSRSRQRRAPHNLFASTADLRRGAESRGFPMQSPPQPASFRPKPGRSGSVRNIELRFSEFYRVGYDFVAKTGRYYRSVQGIPAKTPAGAPVLASNVIVQFVDVRLLDEVRDAVGTRCLDIGLVGSGRAVVFRNGSMVNGSWVKPDREAKTVFRDEKGAELAFDPGTSWVEVTPTGSDLRFGD